ncbi:hypothetical protein ASD56_04425 [Microbacterium sp. Root166]|uniref:hypothetical protein n=1 Tax=Microbacterium sp. Root166 TaxID=1736478 RepID=UPI0006F80740|nr:hypothetical protein [Microbacterium sp. Root166]KQZ85567.1 hypothetical protein ASD56_04425 [Microbacterium sp. Root166]
MPAAAAPSDRDRTLFWVVAVLGIPAAVIAWNWYGFAQWEAQTEQPKALSADNTMAGFGEMFGGIPLVLAHFVGLAVLLTLGWAAYGRQGLLRAVIAVAVASVIGIAIAQIGWGGELFELGINNTDPFVP